MAKETTPRAELGTTRTDMFLLDGTINISDEQEMDYKLSAAMSIGRLQDTIGEIVESYPQASSFVFTVVRRVTHTKD